MGNIYDTIVYDTQELYLDGVVNPTNITGGPHPVWFMILITIDTIVNWVYKPPWRSFPPSHGDARGLVNVGNQFELRWRQRRSPGTWQLRFVLKGAVAAASMPGFFRCLRTPFCQQKGYDNGDNATISCGYSR